MEFFPTSQSLNPMIKSENETNSNKILTQNPNKNMNIIQNSNTKPTDSTLETGTMISSLAFIQKTSNIDLLKSNIINDIQEDNKTQKEEISTTTGQDLTVTSFQESTSKNDTVVKKSFAGKTKQWVGNLWNSIKKIKIFPKEEFLEYRNANGDMVKVPKKKLPLKKKKNVNENVNKIVAKEKNKVINNFHDAASDYLLCV